MKHVGLILLGQSNQSGTSYAGGHVDNYISQNTGLRDPFLGTHWPIEGGSCLPFLIDLGMARNVRYHACNCAIGSASIMDFVGLVGATVSGSQSYPLTYGSMGSSGLTASAGAAPVAYGGSGFDPFGLLANALQGAKNRLPNMSSWVVLWANGEADAGTYGSSPANLLYQQAIYNLAYYWHQQGVQFFLPGLSSCPATMLGGYPYLQTAVVAAVAHIQAAGWPNFTCAEGADLFRFWGGNLPTPVSNAPLYREMIINSGVSVHQTLRGQMLAAQQWNNALIAATT